MVKSDVEEAKGGKLEEGGRRIDEGKAKIGKSGPRRVGQGD